VKSEGEKTDSQRDKGESIGDNSDNDNDYYRESPEEFTDFHNTMG
jgi:hypothetical protein